MENYENKELYTEPTAPQPEEPVSQESAPASASREPEAAPVFHEPVSQPYSGAGVGRKESPFADSPYVVNHQPETRTYRQPDPNAYRCGSTYVPPIPPYQPPVKPKKEKKAKSGKVWKGILAAVLALAVVAGSCGITAALVNNRWEKTTDEILARVDVQTAYMEDLRQQIAAAQQAADKAAMGNSVSGTIAMNEGLTPSQVYARNVQSVVLITCEVTATNAFGQATQGQSSGSGFILTENGYVVTNAHVVAGATAITVSTHTGEELSAKLVGSDTTNDVAVLKVEAQGLPAVTIGSSTELIVGDQVVAIGNPLGELTSTMTVGYVSAKDRDVTTDGTTINMIQTDAAINSGNSGGPLFNMKGEVVGITTAKYSGASASGASIESIGFAIPIDDVIGMLNDLKDYGYVTGAFLGVMVSDMDKATAAYYGMPVGVYVQEVTPGYCAEKAGIQAKDIIVKLGDYEVESLTDLTRALRNFKAGDTTEITVYRSGAEKVLSITLDEKPGDTGTTVPEELPQGQMPENGSYDEWYDFFFGGKDD